MENLEVKLGEMLEAIPNKPATSAKGGRSLPKDITHKQSHYAQELARQNNMDTLKIHISTKAIDTGPLTKAITIPVQKIQGAC